MKTTKLIVMLLGLFVAAIDVNAALTITQEGCGELKVVNSELACANCYAVSQSEFNYQMGYLWKLQKKSGSSWVNVGDWGQGGKTYTKGSLGAGTYRVQGRHSKPKGTFCINVYNFDDNPLNSISIGCVGEWVYDGTSNPIEIGQPTVSASLWDNSGNVGNNVFCSGDPVYIDASSSFGEQKYYISMSLLEGNSQLAWTSTGWINGKIGVVNLKDVWTMSHPDWNLWAGYTYRVMIALSNTCDGWESKTYDFYVVSSGCKTGISLETPLTIYPNPANNHINIKGYDDLEGEVNITVFDLQGKTVKSETLYSNTLDINNLNDGMYLVQITNEEGVIHSDKLMVRGNSK